MSGFISGRKNCHLAGLNSYVIRDRINRNHGMIRVFHNTGDCLPSLTVRGKFALAPHNHRQDITLSSIKGAVTNVSFKWDSRAPEKHFWEWMFYSQIVDGEIKAHYHNTGDLRITNIEPIKNGLFLPSHVIHTVIAEPGAAWLIREGKIAENPSLCYSNHAAFRLSQDGLYSELSRFELDKAWEELAELLPYGEP